MPFLRASAHIQPIFCDKHACSMMPVLIELDGSLRPAYKCANCRRFFDVKYGYFTVEADQPDCREEDQQRCKHDGFPMYVQAFSLQGNARQWQCAQIGCPGGTMK